MTMKIGIIKEGKVPSDSRTPLVPEQCKHILDHFPVELVVQRSPHRSFDDREYEKAGIPLCDDLNDCDVLMGVKEVPVNMLIPEKTYLFFSHTVKKQPHNRRLLQAVLEKHIRLIDYELLTDEHGRRLIAFGRFAGMVGAHNALFTYGERTGLFSLKRMRDCHDYREAKAIYGAIRFPAIRLVVTGGGRVGTGACEVLQDMGFKRVAPADFLAGHFDHPVFTQLNPEQYAARKDGMPFTPQDYYDHPEEFISAFFPYARVADIFINGIFYDRRAPAFFTIEEMKKPEFYIQVIADVTCDIVPHSSIPSTIRASTMDNPVYGFDPVSRSETQPFQDRIVDVMAIDNLPNEMPRDSSHAFGAAFIEKVLPELLQPHSRVIERATIADKGHLAPHFMYLQDFVEGETA